MLVYWTGTASEIAVKTIAWTIFLLVPIAIVRLFRSLINDLILAWRKLIIVMLLWVVYAMVYFTLTRSIVPPGYFAWWITPALLPLLAFVLAPWAVNHVRHR